MYEPFHSSKSSIKFKQKLIFLKTFANNVATLWNYFSEFINELLQYLEIFNALFLTHVGAIKIRFLFAIMISVVQLWLSM